MDKKIIDNMLKLLEEATEAKKNLKIVIAETEWGDIIIVPKGYGVDVAKKIKWVLDSKILGYEPIVYKPMDLVKEQPK